MSNNSIISRCDRCDNILDINFTFRWHKEVLCQDCYLRIMGYDPEEIGRRFAEFAKKLFADIQMQRDIH